MPTFCGGRRVFFYKQLSNAMIPQGETYIYIYIYIYIYRERERERERKERVRERKRDTLRD